jgi:hypothetical protein
MRCARNRRARSDQRSGPGTECSASGRWRSVGRRLWNRPARARAHATDRGVDVEFRSLDLNELSGFGEDALDGALCSARQVLESPAGLIRALRSALRPGGCLLVESVRQLGGLSHGANLGLRDRAINGLKAVAVKLRHRRFRSTPLTTSRGSWKRAASP